MAEITEHKSKAIHELEMYIAGVVGLQLAGKDVAIPFLQGAPGGGKTSMVNAWAKKYGWNLLSVHFALQPIEEISGIPDITEIQVNGETVKGTQWTYPDILTNMYKMDQSKPTVLFLDDFHLCSQDHLNLGFEMFTNRAIRGFPLPKNSAFILAGNSSSKSGTKAGNSAIINRCAMDPVHTDFDHWKRNFAFPHGVNYKILSFLSNEKYRKYFHMEEMTNKPWASPRSWTRFSEILTPLEQALNNNIAYSDLTYYAESHVGAEAASEFAAYYKLYLETEMEKVFDAKKEIQIPDDMTGQYIYVLSAVGEFFNRLGNKDNAKVEAAYNTFANIIISIGKKSLSIATVGARELVESGNMTQYMKYKKIITAIDSKIADRISNEIRLI
jgi:hypothetical protein